MQTEEDLHVALPNNPFVPPEGDVCFVKSLPPELLHCIFELGTMEDDDSDDEDGHVPSSTLLSGAALRGHQFPFVTSSVCRDWHTITCRIPSLWTTIVITNASTSPYLHVTTLLARSGSLPLDIYFKLPFDLFARRKGPSDADLALIFSTLVGHIHRWRTIEVVSEYDLGCMNEFLKAVSGPSAPAAPRLETLKLCYFYYREEDDLETPTIITHPHTLFSGSAPLLTTIILSGVHVNWDQPWIASNPNVIDLRLMLPLRSICPTWTQFAAVLQGASSLKTLTLDRSGSAEVDFELFRGSGFFPNPPIELPRVTDFVLGRHSEYCAIELIHILRLPALTNLVISVGQDNFFDLVDALAELEPDRPSLLRGLESLTLGEFKWEDEYDYYDATEDDSIERFYDKLENLKTLKIAESTVDRRFLDLLCVLTECGDAWLPELEELYISGASGHRIRKVVHERNEMGLPLRVLHVEKACVKSMEEVRRKVETIKIFDRKRWGVPWMDIAEI